MRPLLPLLALLLSLVQSKLVPTAEVKLYPNTEASPSLYMISFETDEDMANNEYMLVSLDWIDDPIDPHSCILVNSSKAIECTNLNNPDPDFDLAFSTDALLNHNDQIDLDRTLIVLLKDGLDPNVEYHLEFALHNLVENISKISPSIETYLINRDGLVYEENLNFGAVVYKPPQTNLLDVSILTDLSQNEFGSLSTLKA